MAMAFDHVLCETDDVKGGKNAKKVDVWMGPMDEQTHRENKQKRTKHLHLCDCFCYKSSENATN